MSRKAKKKSPQQIAAGSKRIRKSEAQLAREAEEQRARDFEALGLPGHIANLPTQADVLVERATRQSADNRGNVDRARRQAGLDWLWNKKRLEPHQMQAGLKYGDDYRAATDARVRSCMASATGGDLMFAQEHRAAARQRLLKAQKEGLANHPSMTNLCNRVAGEGERVTEIANGNDPEAKKLEAVLCVSLDLLAKHYGIITA